VKRKPKVFHVQGWQGPLLHSPPAPAWSKEREPVYRDPDKPVDQKARIVFVPKIDPRARPRGRFALS
jgi:hypothetical protein